MKYYQQNKKEYIDIEIKIQQLEEMQKSFQELSHVLNNVKFFETKHCVILHPYV